MKTRILILTSFFIFPAFAPVDSQKSTDPIRIDKNGRMVWNSGGTEAFFWGVNYTAPFAHAYRQIARLGFDRKEAIDADVYHLTRLGINAYRIHVWDCEISDAEGNLLVNEHLDLLDYLISRLQERGIYVFLTPIAYWGNGYPEPNENLPGFSMKWNKGNIYIEPEAIAAQERYLKQFVSHINPYTKKPYRSDPMIIGFEVCNEPGHSKAEETTEFVKRTIKAIRSTGCTKPVFYNVTQSINLLRDFIKGGTDGVTFQWYPAGLVANHEIRGNYLPHVDNYYMPFRNERYFTNQARLVYEFDAADVGRSYLYPPIALSFKEAGMQWVTMFAYDPLVMAASNTEYQTHFLNLAYSPQKAIGFKIAGELFRNPGFRRERQTEKKPFEIDGFRSDYASDMAELVTDELFFYTNNTGSVPPDITRLKSVAGYGSSPVVSYKGHGAYFLDRVGDGTWRLEVMPDAVWVRDPFSRATPRIENVVIKWKEYEMGISLPDLGKDFMVNGVNRGNIFSVSASGGTFHVSPGVYILAPAGSPGKYRGLKTGSIIVEEFHAPPETNNDFYFLPDSPAQVSAGKSFEIGVKLVSPPAPVRNLVLRLAPGASRARVGQRLLQINMKRVDEYNYSAVIPDSMVRPGLLNYNIIIEPESGEVVVYPGGVKGPLNTWDYFNPEFYTVKVLNGGSETELFSAVPDNNTVTFSGNPGVRSSLELSGVTGGSMLRITFSPFSQATTRNSIPGVRYVLQNYIGDVIKSISGHAGEYTVLKIVAKATGVPVKAEVSLTDRDGNTFTSPVTFRNDIKAYEIRLTDLKPGRMFLLPRPYPGFLPWWYYGRPGNDFSLSEVERIQIVVPDEGNEGAEGFEINSVTLK